jgi:hypothetical protein
MSKQSEYKTRVTQLSVLPPGVQTIGDKSWSIEIEHGEYVSVSDIHNGGMIEIDPEEWPALRGAIDRMIGECINE